MKIKRKLKKKPKIFEKNGKNYRFFNIFSLKIAKNKKFIIFLLLLVCLIFMTNPSVYKASCLEAVSVWAVSVFPVLFPFFILTRLIVGLMDTKETFGDKFFKKFYHTPAPSSTIYFLSILSGYPMGAKLICTAYENKKINNAEARRMLSFCSVSGPMFIIGTVGISFLLSFRAGLIILIANIIASLINGLLYRGKINQKISSQSFVKTSKISEEKTKVIFDDKIPLNEKILTISSNFSKKDENNKQKQTLDKKNLSNRANPAVTQDKNLSALLPDAVYDSINSILMVGAYIVLSFLIIDVLKNLNIIPNLANIVGSVFHINDTAAIESVLCGLIEMTRGVLDLSKTGLSLGVKTVIASALIGGGGLSVMLQSLSFLSKLNISAKDMFKQKCSQAILSALVAIPLVLMLL